MAHVEDNDRLSWGDSLFVYLERDCAPLNVAAVTVFEGDIKLDDCTRFIESKLPPIPRYRQRVVIPPMNMGLPVWDWDPKFDIRNHVHERRLKSGDEQEFKAAASDVLSNCLDPEHPRWDFTLLRGLKNGRTGMVVRVHHCLADGIAGIGLMNVIMDSSPKVPRLPRKRIRFEAPPPRDPASLLVDGFITSSFSVVQKLLSMQSDILGIAEKVLASRGWPVEEFLRLLPSLAAPIQRMPFNTVCKGPERFGWTEVPLDEIKAIRHAFEVSVNDVVLAIFTLAFRKYALSHGVDLKERLLRIVVPVNVRNHHNQNDLGNRISFIPVSVPLEEGDPRKIIAAVHRCMDFLKVSHAADFVGLFGSMLSLMPVPMQAVAWPLLSKAPISLCNVICTNVPGPQEPLYLLGHKLLSCYPHVPIGGEMGINCAVLTYNGGTYFGLTSDVNAMPDLPKFEQFIDESFGELAKAARVKVAHPKQQAIKRRPRVAAKRTRGKAPTGGHKRPSETTPTRVVTFPATPEPESPADQEHKISVAVSAD
jgi:diacylglycerol O-acyltransferase